MFLIALLIVFGLTAAFAVENPVFEHVTLLGYSWDVATWVPVAVGVGLIGALLLLHMVAADLGYRFRRFGHQRELQSHQGLVEDLRQENDRLREQLAELRSRSDGQPARERLASRLDDIRTRLAR